MGMKIIPSESVRTFLVENLFDEAQRWNLILFFIGVILCVIGFWGIS